MKKLLLTACIAAMVVPAARADDVALLTFQIGKDKTPKQAAIEFYDADAPLTVANFKKLVHKKFYNGTALHRVFPDTLVQMGDPFSKGKERAKVGTGGPGYTLPPEIHRKHTLGAVAAGQLPGPRSISRAPFQRQPVRGLPQAHAFLRRPVPSSAKCLPGPGHPGSDQPRCRSTRKATTPLKRVEIISVKIIPREQLPAAARARLHARSLRAKQKAVVENFLERGTCGPGQAHV